MAESGYRDALRAKVLAVTREIVEREGVAAAQARRVAKEADCSVGSLYNVFGDIDGLILALNTQTLAALGDGLVGHAKAVEGQPLQARLEALAIGYLRFASANRERWDAVFHYRRISGTAVPDAYLADQGRLLALIELEISAVLTEPVARNHAARALFGSLHGIVVLAMDDRLGGESRNDFEAQIRFIVGLVAKGLMLESAPLNRTADAVPGRG